MNAKPVVGRLTYVYLHFYKRTTFSRTESADAASHMVCRLHLFIFICLFTHLNFILGFNGAILSMRNKLFDFNQHENISDQKWRYVSSRLQILAL